MAREQAIGGNGEFFQGEDKTLKMRLWKKPKKDGILIDMTGWDVIWVVRKKDSSADPAILEKTATIEGTFDPDPEDSTQYAVVQLTDDETNLLTKIGTAAYRHSWKRMDDNRETVLSYGNLNPQQATAR